MELKRKRFFLFSSSGPYDWMVIRMLFGFFVMFEVYDEVITLKSVDTFIVQQRNTFKPKKHSKLQS